jgi:gliding motility-associated-like protein
VRNASGCTTTGSSFLVSCGCTNGPTLTLSSLSGSTCGTTPAMISGNTFTNATSVTITYNGGGSVTPTTSGTSPFAFTYTPAAADEGKTVIITVTTDNPLGLPCAAASATYTLNVTNSSSAPTVGPITQPTCITPAGSVVLNNLPSGTWTINPGTITGTGSSYTISGLIAGTYNYTVTDASGCTSSATSDILVNPVPLSPAAPMIGTITQSSSCAELTGSVVLNGLPETGTWTINPGAISGTGTSYTISGLSAGTYSYTVNNEAGCISLPSASVLINAASQITSTISDYNGFNVSCYGNSNGYIRISPAGDPSLCRFNWSGPDGFKSSSKDISGLKAGKYVLEITDINNCSVTESFELSEPGKLGISIDLSVSRDGSYNINCAGESTGSVVLTAINNAGTVSYLWGDGFTGNDRTQIPAGIYKIIIKDSNGCLADSSIRLSSPEPITIKLDAILPFCPDSRDGEITSIVTGGIEGDYIYKWSDNSYSNNISGITEGKYTLVVNDINKCSAKDSIYIKAINESCLIIPNAISPNGDLINDVLNIGNAGLYPQMEVTIFNNWGQTIWKSEKGYPVPWDGKSNGKKLPIDSYFYIINLHNGSKQIAGSVTLIK